MVKKRKQEEFPHLPTMLLLQCSTANSQKRALLLNALSVRSAAVSRLQNSLIECRNLKVGFFCLVGRLPLQENFQRLPQFMHSQKVVIGSSAARVWACV
jgi:hypothetical protein